MPAAGPQTGLRTVPGSLLVTAATPQAANRLHGELDADPANGTVRSIGARVLNVRTRPAAAADLVTALEARRDVVAVDADRVRARAAVPNDPDYDDQWAHAQAGAPEAWDEETGDPTVRVAILDDGTLGTHPDLEDNILETQVSTADGEVTETGVRVDNDPCKHGHGTLVSGVVGAVGDNGRNLAGAAWRVSLVDVSLASPDVGCDGFADSAILTGLDYAINNARGPVDVINLSIGGVAEACPHALQSLVGEARAAGTLVVAASGNYGTEETVVPASCNGVISVGATGPSGRIADYSTRNPYVDIVAPGGDAADGRDAMILTTSRDHPLESTDYVEGTSFSAPYVAGVVALLRSAVPDLTADNIESILESTAKDIASEGRDAASGWGLIRADAALAAAVSGSFPENPRPDPEFPVDGRSGTIPPPGEEPEVFRIAAKQPTTDAIPQAVAASFSVFDDREATHVILARNDNYADALAGSALSSGSGPLLFTRSEGSLAPLTRDELRRVLPRGGIVYLLGGPNALPPQVEDEVRRLGYEAVRLAGPSREETAVAIAREVDRRNLRRIDAVVLATRGNWPDAVTGGSIAAAFGTPILLTAPDRLHPATARTLKNLNPSVLYVLGGPRVISEEVLRAAGTRAGVSPSNRIRLAGSARDGTAVAIGNEVRSLLRKVDGVDPTYAVAVNVRRPDGFAHVLSASVIPGRFGAVFVPVEGTDGSVLTKTTREFVSGLHADGVVIGSRDLIVDRTGEELLRLLRDG